MLECVFAGWFCVVPEFFGLLAGPPGVRLRPDHSTARRSRSTRRARSSARPRRKTPFRCKARAARHAADRHRPVRHRHRDAERRNPAQHRRHAWRRAAIQARHHLVRLCAGRGEPPRGARPRQLSRPHPGERRSASTTFRPQRRPCCADRPTVGAAGRGDPRTGHAALRLAGDRRRGQRRQQPHSDLHPAARLCRRSQRRADQRRQRRRGRGAARRRQGQLRLPCRRLQPHRAGLPDPELPLSVSARSARRWSATGSPTAWCARTASRSAAPIFSTAALSASRCRGSAASIAFPASRRPRPARASTSTRPRSPARANSGPAPPRSTRCGSGPAPPTTSITNWRNENGFDGVQQTFTNRAQEGRVEVQLMPFDLRFATLTTAIGTQAAHQKLAAPGHNRRRPARSEHDAQHRRLHLQRVPASATAGARRSPAASSASRSTAPRPTSRPT